MLAIMAASECQFYWSLAEGWEYKYIWLGDSINPDKGPILKANWCKPSSNLFFSHKMWKHSLAWMPMNECMH